MIIITSAAARVSLHRCRAFGPCGNVRPSKKLKVWARLFFGSIHWEPALVVCGRWICVHMHFQGWYAVNIQGIHNCVPTINKNHLQHDNALRRCDSAAQDRQR
jgi:hypothetical protein